MKLLQLHTISSHLLLLPSHHIFCTNAVCNKLQLFKRVTQLLWIIIYLRTFHIHTVHLDIIKALFIHQLMH